MKNFYEQAQIKSNCTRMTPEATRIFALASLTETSMQGKAFEAASDIPEEKMTFPQKIVLSRVKQMKLPIDFSTYGLIAGIAVCENNPGRCISMLVDLMTKYDLNENKRMRVTSREIADLYPWGHYKEEVFAEYVDSYLKPNKVKWAEIY